MAAKKSLYWAAKLTSPDTVLPLDLMVCKMINSLFIQAAYRWSFVILGQRILTDVPLFVWSFDPTIVSTKSFLGGLI